MTDQATESPAASDTQAPALTRKQQAQIARAQEIQEAQGKINAILSEYGVKLRVTQLMQLGTNGGPVYAFNVEVVDAGA